MSGHIYGNDTKANDAGSTSANLPHCPPSGVHKVRKPPKQKLIEEITATVKETLFSDDPLGSFKDQTQSRKFILAVQAVFPIFSWIQDYSLSKFKGDLIAGLTIASLSIPQDIGYAKLANLPMENGLYCSFVPPLVYAFMGSSRDLAIGPVAVVSLLMGDQLQKELDSKDPDYKRLAFTATFFAGITQMLIGFLRLGFLIDFLSRAVIVGFMGGAAVTIGLQQLKGLLGIKHFTKKTDIVSVLRSVFNTAHHGWNWQTIVIGVSFLAFLVVAKYIGKRHKKYFWVPAIAPMISVIVSTFFVYLTKANEDGVQIVNHITKGINPASADQIFFGGEFLRKGFRIGAVAGIIGLTEAIAIGKTFAAMKSYQIDGNREMVALGTMNVVGSMTSCYVASGGFSRSSVNCMAGCQTLVSNIVMSGVVFLTLMVITPLFKYTPNTILASIIIVALSSLFDFEAVALIWKIDKFDFAACIGAFFGVIFTSVETGLLIAVSLSFAKILLHVTRPRTAILGELPSTSLYMSILHYPEATKIPGVVIVRVDSAIYFCNSNYIKERTLRWLAEEEEQLTDKTPRIQNLVLEMSPVTDIDTNGIHALQELYMSLQKKGIQLALANPGPVVIGKLHASHFVDVIGENNIFLSIADAIDTFSPKITHEEP